MKKYLFLLLAFFIILGLGCATNRDLKRVQRGLKQEILVLKKDMEGNREFNKSFRKEQAEIGADMTDLRNDVQELRGVVEELNRNVQSGGDIRESLREISFRVNYMENFLGIVEKKESRKGSKRKEEGSITSKDTTKKKIGKEVAYAAAYKTFKEGKYKRARVQFQEFLKQFPATEYSDNAQFWIGECYFFEREYEKAILEYEKVIKNYPGGNKVPYALLKQGMSFLKLGDESSAKLLLQQIIKDYPNTSQARIAREKLVEIK